MVYSGTGTALISCSVSFCLGCLLMSWVVDHRTLWEAPTEFALNIAEQHYRTLADVPRIIAVTLHTVIGLGLVGHVMKLHKGNQSNTLFDGGSLILMLVAVVIYGANILRGIRTVRDSAYEEVNRSDTLRVIAASNVLAAAALLGSLVLQVGQGAAERAALQEEATFKKQVSTRKKTI